MMRSQWTYPKPGMLDRMKGLMVVVILLCGFIGLVGCSSSATASKSCKQAMIPALDYAKKVSPASTPVEAACSDSDQQGIYVTYPSRVSAVSVFSKMDSCKPTGSGIDSTVNNEQSNDHSFFQCEIADELWAVDVDSAGLSFWFKNNQ